MPQIFHHSLNAVAKIILVGVPLMGAGTGIGLATFYRSGYATGMSEVIEQPVPFSHKHHVGELGIDCRYCHNSVETAGYAGIPPTKVCMNCHQQIWVGAELLRPVRESYRLDKPIVWNRVHNTPGNGADVPVEDVADGMVREVPSRSRLPPPPPRRGFQHDLETRAKSRRPQNG